jgi:hypothetical protein
MTHVELEFEKYQYFYLYQWKVSHIEEHRKLRLLEAQARELRLKREREAYEAKVREHD